MSQDGWGGAVLDSDSNHDYEDLMGRLVGLQLARPALFALAAANGPMRQSDLTVTLVASRGRPVHSRTLANAVRFLAGAGLITRQEEANRRVVYEVTRLGHKYIVILDAADRVAREAGDEP